MGKVVAASSSTADLMEWVFSAFFLSCFRFGLGPLFKALLVSLLPSKSQAHRSTDCNTVLSVIFLLGLLDPLNLETATAAAADYIEVCKQVQGVFFLMKRVYRELETTTVHYSFSLWLVFLHFPPLFTLYTASWCCASEYPEKNRWWNHQVGYNGSRITVSFIR